MIVRPRICLKSSENQWNKETPNLDLHRFVKFRFSTFKTVSQGVLFLLMWFLSACVHQDLKLYGYPTFEVVVQKGDTLTGLGEMFAVPWRMIEYVNDLKNHELKPGQVLQIPQTEDAWQSVAVRHRLREKKNAALPPELISSNESGQDQVGFFFARQGKLMWPVNGRLSSGFGPRGGRIHSGIDIRAPKGSEIRAATGGKVTFSGWKRGYGRTVVIDHGGFKTLYAHCSELEVKKGDWVDQGTRIARVGSSGRASGPHLHFELHSRDGRAINPLSEDLADIFTGR